MPPLNVGGGVGTLRDSGIGDDYPTPSRHGASKDSSNVNLHRNGTDRSSFGMILKVTEIFSLGSYHNVMGYIFITVAAKYFTKSFFYA